MSLTNQVINWLDVFLCYPRAYLLILTLVDYSLSIGRLPHDINVPEFLWNVLLDTPKIKLPWMTKTDLINQTDLTRPDFWCPSYCAPTGPLSVMRRQNDGLNLPSSAGGGLIVGVSKLSH
jgi:hypothetical protein